MSALEGGSATLELTGITKLYPGVRALDEVSLTASSGRVHAVLGENGAGKSTLVGIAAGSVVPDAGSVMLGGQASSRITTSEARDRGLAIVYQIPALAPSLSVTDAVLLLLPSRIRPSRRDATSWVRGLFSAYGLQIDPTATVADLSLREAHLVEIAAALAAEPSVLILDEPTEALGPEETEWLFERIQEQVTGGTAIIYITHRIPEVVAIGDDLTVLRDGTVVGRGLVADYSADAIVELIIGRSLETTFPEKGTDRESSENYFVVDALRGTGFDGVSFSAARGEITGLAGVEGNGQREVMRALAGSGKIGGTVSLSGAEVDLRSLRAAAREGVAFLPGDRLGEAMFGKMSIRENVIAAALPTAMPHGVVSSRREYALTRAAISGFAVKTPTLDTTVASLSGGGQQKVLLARSRVGQPKVLLVEDPTQGVDAGARVEIYAFLREVAESGVAVVILSTDAVELEGLCDQVVVFSRGKVQAVLRDDQITERAITGAAVLSTETGASTVQVSGPRQRQKARPRRESQAVVLLVLAVLLAGLTTLNSAAFLSPLSLSQMLLAASVLVFVGLAQLVVVMTGGIDLSVGAVAALSGVVISYFGQAGPAVFVLGILLAIVAGALAGAINGLLVTRLSLPPVIATLVVSIAVLGVAQVLRPSPGGSTTAEIMSILGTTIAGVPLLLLLALAVAVGTWVVLQRTHFGRSLRAAGSDATKANRMGVGVSRMRFAALVGSGALASLAGVVLYSKTGIGDANTGDALTLISVTAIVIAGVSIFGGSGSALAVAAAGILLQVITSALSFLSLNLSWQYWVQGAFVLLAAALPLVVQLVRRRREQAGLPVPRRSN